MSFSVFQVTLPASAGEAPYIMHGFYPDGFGDLSIFTSFAKEIKHFKNREIPRPTVLLSLDCFGLAIYFSDTIRR